MQILGSGSNREDERTDHSIIIQLLRASTDGEQGVEEVIIPQQDMTTRLGRCVRTHREFEVELEVHTC